MEWASRSNVHPLPYNANIIAGLGKNDAFVKGVLLNLDVSFISSRSHEEVSESLMFATQEIEQADPNIFGFLGLR